MGIGKAIRLAAISAVTLSTICGQSASAQKASVESETSDVAKMEPPKPNWFFVNNGWYNDGTSIYDAATGKMKGLVSTSHLSDLAIDPAGKYYYVSETIWSKGNRGTRQDMVSVYDSVDLKLQVEIAIPSRILVSDRKQNFLLSDDGKWGFVYEFSPASSVNIVDLTKRKFLKNVEIPGCATLIPNPVGFSALCSDGSMGTVSLASSTPQITSTAPFFSAFDDPIFENFGYDKAKKQAVFLTYSGQIYTAQMSATPTISSPFSIQVAAGYRQAESKSLDLAWYPGGRQPMALHSATGMLYVLMHTGEYWSHKKGADEIWVLDIAARKVVKRLPVKDHVVHIEITQDAAPKLFVNTDEGLGIIIDPATGKENHRIEQAGGGVIAVAVGG
jgi:methylamine dehydrogenase heavy chain